MKKKNLQNQIEQIMKKIILRDNIILKLQTNECLCKEQNQLLTQQLKQAR